jgi:competence protein ComEC
MGKRPLVAIACSWVAGAAVLSLWQGWEAVFVLAGLLTLLVASALMGKPRWPIAVCCALALLGAAGHRAAADHGNTSAIIIPQNVSAADAVATGYISSTVEVDGDLVTLELTVHTLQLSTMAAEQHIHEKVLLRVKLQQQPEQKQASAWGRGDALRVTGRLELPGEAGNFGAFDYRDYLQKRGIHWQLQAQGTDSVDFGYQTKVPLYVKPLRTLDDIRSHIAQLMDSLYPDGDAGYMKGLVAGIRSDLNPEQFDDFSRLGLTHVLAISGLHVAVVVFLILKISSWMRLTRERSLAIAIALMPVYMMLTGASPSAVRACLMAMLALWLARRNALKDGLHLLSAAAMLMLIWDPLLIEDVSFQLSFIVTAGLILCVSTVTASLPVWKWLRGPLAVALTAQAVSFPVTVYYFHSVHLLSLPANLILVPFISFIVMPLGMVSVVFGAIWLPSGKIAAMLASLGNRWTFDLVDWLSGFGALRTVWPQPSWTWVFSAYLVMGAIFVLLNSRLARKREEDWWREKESESRVDTALSDITAPLNFSRPQLKSKGLAFYSIGAGTLTLMWLVWGFQPAVFDGAGKVMFLDVGQADSILVRTGEGRHILIDSGGSVLFRKAGNEWRERRDPFDPGRKLIVPLLLQRGVRELDALVLTHLDTDHIGGAKAVIASIPVRKILFNGTLKDSSAVKELFQLALDNEIPCYAADASMNWEIDGTTRISILYPQTAHGEPEVTIPFINEQNERSIVLLVTVYGRRFLLPGDVESAGEVEIVNARPFNGAADVLKAAHHGSKTSTSRPWLSYWQPVETVISVGRNNLYGHPNGDVVQRIADSGSLLFRTDRHGEIEYRISPDGQLSRRIKHFINGERQ